MPRLKPYSQSAFACVGRNAAEHAANLRAAAEEVRGLAADDLEVLFGRDVDVAGLGELEQLALDHPQRHVAEQANDVERILGQRQGHRLDVQVVAEEHRDVVAPARMHGEPGRDAARASSMMSSCTSVAVWMNSTTDAYEDRALALVAGQPRRHQQEGGPNALAPARLDVASDLRNQLHARLHVPDELLVDPGQILANGLEDLR